MYIKQEPKNSSEMQDITKTIMFTNALQSSTPTTIQYQTADGILKQPKIEGQKGGQSQQEFPTFCYTTNANATVNLAQLAEDKTCYIAQPLGYNYALVNHQMQLTQNGTVAGIATVDGQGRIQVVNKPLTVNNTVSSVSFKCDVCGLMFSHLTLLNHHKRIHSQENNENGQDGITVVTQAQNISGNLVTEGGQTLGQIQIVATESLEPANSLQQQHQNQQQQNSITTVKTVEKTKCITCGNPIISNSTKRKGHKLIRCETCINNDSQTNNVNNRPTATQIFVSSDGDVKFEVGEIPNNATTVTGNFTLPGHHPVKRKGLASVTKCQKCNGTGVIFIGGSSRVKTEAPKPYQCNICGGTFSRYSSLWSHKKLHSGEKNYKCQVCGIAFAKAVYLKNHSRIHTGEKPYKCQTCGMQFSQSPHLKNHERTHSGEKPYVCEVCDKGFARHATLWNHRRIHTGEKPYKCEICGSAFSQAAHLKNHAKVHSGEKPFKCDICSAAFADRFALKRHRGIHEKYGQTAPRQPAQVPADQQQQQQQQSNIDNTHTVVIQKQEVTEIEEDSQQHTEVIISGL